MTPISIMVTSSGRHALASKPRGGSTNQAPESEGSKQSEGGSDVEMDREDLIMLIDSRAQRVFKDLYQTYIAPMHEENKRDNREMKGSIDSLVAYMHRSQGGVNMAKGGWTIAEKLLAAAGAVVLLVIQHYWK